jgi:hypothetical protein
LRDQTEIVPKHCGDYLVVDVTGLAYSISECGELLGWLAAALQPQASTAVHITPLLRLDHDPSRMSPNVDFEIHVVNCSSGVQIWPGNDWSSIIDHFANSSRTVKGYPIPRRPGLLAGLEVTPSLFLKALPDLSRENGFTRVNGPKFSLEQLAIVDDVFYWHEAREESELQCAGHSIKQDISKDRASNLNYVDLKAGRYIVYDCETIVHSGQEGKN